MYYKLREIAGVPCYFVYQLMLRQVDRPTDLKNMCLVSREFQDLALPELYKIMILFVGGPQDLRCVETPQIKTQRSYTNRLSAMLGRDNPGIKYIQEIYLRLGNG